MTMSIRVFTFGTLLVLATMTAGCGSERGTGATGAPAARLADTSGTDDPALHDALASMWHNDDGVLMQVFRRTIDCTVGGVFTVHPAGWPEGYDVTLRVDPGTVPLNRDNPVEFVMEIPVTGPVSATSVPFEFHPDGIRFDRPVHIEVVWPEWAGDAPASGMNLWYLEQEYHDGSVHYRVVERKDNEWKTAKLDLPAARFSIDHFSRWTVGDGDDPVDDGTGNSPGGYGDLARVGAGDACWTELGYDPATRLHAHP